MALPLLKCLICPACLSVFGGLLAGARIGFMVNEQMHASILAVALVADVFILRAALRHHHNRWPLVLCLGGAIIAVLGHFWSEALEMLGLGSLVAAAFLNVFLLRRHRREAGSCCAHLHPT